MFELIININVLIPKIVYIKLDMVGKIEKKNCLFYYWGVNFPLSRLLCERICNIKREIAKESKEL